jgi:hypothetical protein
MERHYFINALNLPYQWSGIIKFLIFSFKINGWQVTQAIFLTIYIALMKKYLYSILVENS